MGGYLGWMLLQGLHKIHAQKSAHNKGTFHSLGCIIFEFEQGESSSTSAEVGKYIFSLFSIYDLNKT